MTAQYYTARSLRTIITALEQFIHKYECRSFKITEVHTDNKFDKAAFKVFLEPALAHIHGRQEHVGFIETPVQTVKDRFRSTTSAIPFRRITILMVRSLVEEITDVLNAFPSKT